MAGAVGVNVVAKLAKHEVAAALAAEGEGALGTMVAFPAKSQDAVLRFVISKNSDIT